MEPYTEDQFRAAVAHRPLLSQLARRLSPTRCATIGPLSHTNFLQTFRTLIYPNPKTRLVDDQAVAEARELHFKLIETALLLGVRATIASAYSHVHQTGGLFELDVKPSAAGIAYFEGRLLQMFEQSNYGPSEWFSDVGLLVIEP